MKKNKKLAAFIKKNPKIEFIKCQFSNIPGDIREVTLTVESLLGTGTTSVDGSSVFGKIISPTESEMILVPDYKTITPISWTEDTARVICNVFYPPKKEGASMIPFDGCSRNILTKVLEEMENTLKKPVQRLFPGRKIKRIRAYVAPEVEFMLLPEDYDLSKLHDDPAIKNDHYFAPLTEREDAALKEIIRHLGKMGLKKEKYHAEVSTFQFEVGIGHGNAMKIADGIMTIKSVIKNIACRHGFKASFIPKFNSDVNGDGMHFHFNLSVTLAKGFWGEEKVNLFFDSTKKLGLSKIGQQCIAGLHRYAADITALTNPLPISHKRIVVGAEAPTKIAVGEKNRTALLRLPAAGTKKVRAELRSPDPTCNSYLAEAATISCAIAGIKEGLTMPPLENRDLYHDNDGVDDLPSPLPEALKRMNESKMLRKSLGNFIIDNVFAIGMEKVGQKKYDPKVTAEDVAENF